MRAPAGQLAREAIEALVNADAHLVLCDQGKLPLSAGWQDEANRPTAEMAIAHAAAGGMLGVIPSSINLLAVDVDTDAAGSDLYASMLHRRGLVEKAIGERFATVPTRSGGDHMLYRAPEGEVGNRKWLYGDIRGTRGYCVVWDAARWLAAMSAAPAAEPVNVNALPSTRNGGHHGPVAIAGAPVGERNDTLNREAFKAVAAAKRNGDRCRPAAPPRCRARCRAAGRRGRPHARLSHRGGHREGRQAGRTAPAAASSPHAQIARRR